MTSIMGIPESQNDSSLRLPNIDRRCRSFFEWTEHDVCLVRFENLIGPLGGGSCEAQNTEIRKLAAYAGVQLDAGELEQIASAVYHRGSSTFRKGIIGDWRNQLTPEHRTAFKSVAGQLLVDLGYESDQEW
jgi:hypothetical protein